MTRKFWDAPRDLETIPRSIIRKIKPLAPESSFPLLSGDTFMTMCHYQFNIHGAIEDNPYRADVNSHTKRVFAHAFPESRVAMNLVNSIKVIEDIELGDYELIIHNGDLVPSSSDMNFLASRFKRVHSVNWLGDSKIVNPLPIGLENRSKLRNGVPRDFLIEIEAGLKPFAERDIELLVCFSLHTNKGERSSALVASKNIPGVHIEMEPMTPKAYRQLLLRSKYVLSPPGNGPDCHRTWESIYLGAIPIVLASSWPSFRYQVPAIAIDNWDGLPELISTYVQPSESSIGSPEKWLM